VKRSHVTPPLTDIATCSGLLDAQELQLMAKWVYAQVIFNLIQYLDMLLIDLVAVSS